MKAFGYTIMVLTLLFVGWSQCDKKREQEITYITGKSYVVGESGQEFYLHVKIKGYDEYCKTTENIWKSRLNGDSVLVEYRIMPFFVYGAECKK